MLVLGLICLGATFLVIRRRIVRPLEHLVRTMLLLAEDHIDAHVPRLHRNDELGAMSAALRVFKANTIRRVRLQQNRDSLHDRLKDAYRNMRRDLTAAATVQKAMPSTPLRDDSIRCGALFRPSAVIAGDRGGPGF
jgi:HAMP domain-containing protein